MTTPDVVEKLKQELLFRADESVRNAGLRFFKEAVMLYGIRSADVRAMAKEYYGLVKGVKKDELFGICTELFRSGYLEEAAIACIWSHNIRKSFEPDDFLVFEGWIIKYVNNWAVCDTFCNQTMGAFLEKYPEFLVELRRWALSPNRWMRRASAVSLIVPARQGKFLEDIFGIAALLLTDKDDMVQKGYGWMLKAASQAHQDDVFMFVMRNKKYMPRTALRYAIEKMPETMKKAAMEKP